METISLTGRTTVITGAGRGLGFAYARMLGARGARIVVNDIVGAPEAVAQLREEGVEATANTDDISQPDGAASLIDGARTAYGTIDILVNNAAIGRYTPMSEVTIEEYELVRKVSLDASFFVTREAWPAMTAQQYGRVILTTSGNGLIGELSSVAYSAAKAGVYGLMRALALEGEPLGIKVNCIGPIASTPLAKQAVTEEVAKALDLEYPVELVAPAVVVLASEQCPVTGKVLDVTGGRVGSSFVGTVTGYYDRNLTPESILASWPLPVDHQVYNVFDRAMTYMNTVMAEVKAGQSNT
jgi:NAD(P)-dependent dehydrogenase (short-subunit alcohol dehydrogenase family)